MAWSSETGDGTRETARRWAGALTRNLLSVCLGVCDVIVGAKVVSIEINHSPPEAESGLQKNPTGIW